MRGGSCAPQLLALGDLRDLTAPGAPSSPSEAPCPVCSAAGPARAGGGKRGAPEDGPPGGCVLEGAPQPVQLLLTLLPHVV